MCYFELVLEKQPLGRMQRNGALSRIAAISAGRTKCPLPQLVLANTINPE
jgi:hypothetical protein